MIDKYYFDDFHDENLGLNDTIEKKLNTNDSKINELINNNSKNIVTKDSLKP